MITTLLLPLLLLAAGCGGGEDSRAGRSAAAAAIAAESLPALTGRVVDRANLLTPAVEAALTGRLETLERATRDQLVVVTLASLDSKAIETVGLELGNGWGIGQDELDNGVLLIVAPNERKVRIEVGSGLEGLLSDAAAQAIIDERLLPEFRSGRFETGIEAGVAAMIEILEQDRRRPQPRPLKQAA